MCLYVTYPLTDAVVPNFVSPKTTEATGEALYHYKYVGGTDYSAPANAVPNSLYAVTGPHPSDLTVGSDGSEDGYVAEADDLRAAHFYKRDSEFAIQEGSSISIHITNEYDAAFIGDSTQSHHYGYATCENIGACGGSEKVGSKCYGTAGRGGSAFSGYCYESSSGTLECGRTIEVDSRFASSPLAIKTDARCPAGTALTYPGKMTVKRLLIGGCMIPSDTRYKSSAEIHIPEDCATTADYNKGCVFPGATNYAPGSVQSGACTYRIDGCTSATALNYNSEASDNDGSCIEPVSGCTLKEDAYETVASDTPMYMSRYVGVPKANAGLYVYDGYKSVLNADSTANVLSGCIVAVEGCMDSTAVNYNSLANVNSVTWCVPSVSGCMMPYISSVGGDTGSSDDRPHMHDGGSSNFDTTATVNDVSACALARIGCTDSGAINYDSRATIGDDSCYASQEGCLDPTALNFNCTFLVAPYTQCKDASPRATVHASGVCVYEVLPLPPPSPSYPPGTETTPFVEIAFVAEGDVADYTEEVQESLKETFADAAGVDTDRVTLLIESSSVSITVQIEMDSAEDAELASSALSEEMSDQDTATSFLAAAGVTVLSVPTISAISVAVVAPPSPPPEAEIGGIIGGVVGGIGGVLMLIGIAAGVSSRNKKKATYPA
jgi:hypothetical protein